MARDPSNLQHEKLDLTNEQREIIKQLFGVDLPLQVQVIREKIDGNTKLIITDQLDEQEALDATCAAWC